MGQEAPESKLSRRALLVRGSMGAGAIWTAPVVTNVVARAAAGTPPPCDCTGAGVGFNAAYTSTTPPESGGEEGGNSTGAKNCDQNFPVPLGTFGSIDAQGTCGEFDAQTCTAHADFGEGAFTINALNFTISGEAVSSHITTAGCSCEVAASASALNIDINGTPFSGDIPPNTPITLTGDGGTLSIILNNQFCDGEDSVVQAVNISGTGAGLFVGNTGTIILAESRVNTPGCAGFCAA